jgi:pimeloyl-ACP methyl ester carboxylesterase
VFLHGFPEAAFVWDDMLAHFAAQGFRCVAPNLRGYELSSAPTEVSAYKPRHLVQDVAALIDWASPGQPLACLVAHDWGGALAWNLANQMPQRLAKLAILNSPHPGTFVRELQSNPQQQAASAYMNLLVQPDAEARLADNDFAMLWSFLTSSPGWASGVAHSTPERTLPRHLASRLVRAVQLLPRVAPAPSQRQRFRRRAVGLAAQYADG